MNSFTPGPWDWMAVGANASGGFHLYVIDSTKRKIGALWGKVTEKEANARLIAAAPDMLEALRKLANEVNGVLSTYDAALRQSMGSTNVAVLTDRLELARAAISKATCEGVPQLGGGTQ